MSLTRTDTGQAATPITELEKRSNAYRDMTDTQLLREALAKSNEKCNALLKEQNMLIEDLTAIIEDTKQESEKNAQSLITHEARQTAELRTILAEERQIRAEISRAVRSEVSSTLSDVKGQAIKAVEETVEIVKKEIKETAKEMEKQRHEYRAQSLFQTFFFWFTPILLLVQTILIIVLLYQ